MTLNLWHRRDDPHAVYGGEGIAEILTLHDVVEVKVIYDVVHVLFDTPEAVEVARRLTNWAYGIFSTEDLEMPATEDGCVGVMNPETGKVDYYSDWNIRD